jgi:hypothetical protein
MSLVASGAEQFRVFAWKIFHLFALLAMAGKTGIGEICSQFHIKGCVWISMAGVTAANLVVRLAGVAGATYGYNLFLAHHGRMSLMAASACNCRFVLCTLAVNHCLDTCMALNAVSVQEICRRFRCLFLCTEREEKSGKNKKEKRQYKSYTFSFDDCV